MKAIYLLIVCLLWPLAAIAVEAPFLASLSDAEQEYYGQVFNYAMDTIGPDGSYQWQTYSANGTITVGAAFTSKSKARCRKFKETFAAGGRPGGDEGVACRRDKRDGWCRLKSDNAYTCAMEPPGSIMEKGAQEAGDAVESSKGILGEVKGWFR